MLLKNLQELEKSKNRKKSWLNEKILKILINQTLVDFSCYLKINVNL